MRITVRMSDELEQRLAEAAQGRGVDVSMLVREACTTFLDGQTSGPPIPSGREPARTTNQPPDAGSQGILQMRSPEGRTALRQSPPDMPVAAQMAWGSTRAMTPPPPMHGDEPATCSNVRYCPCHEVSPSGIM